MENTVNKETTEESDIKRAFHGVLNKLRNPPKPKEAGRSTSNTKQTQPEKDCFEMGTPGFAETETFSSDSDSTIAVPAINFKRYLGTTGVRYINMGEASKVQDDPLWDLEKTVHKVEQKFATDSKTIKGEATNDEKLLKTLVGIERQTPEQVPDEFKRNITNTYPQDLASLSTMVKS